MKIYFLMKYAGKINRSGRESSITELKNAFAWLPEIREDKVRTIQKALADGTYKIDSRKVAARLINEMI